MNRKISKTAVCILFIVMVLPISQPQATAAQTSNEYKVLGWNNLGMHCLDSDFSVFSILPPYNTIHSQIIDNQGHLLSQTGNIDVTYHAVADPDGSINTTSAGKTNFWDFEDAFFGISLPVDVGLPVPGPNSFSMPGPGNVPQTMEFETSLGWFAAYGIPITPTDDANQQNAYPLMRLTAMSGATVLGSSDIVLPVSDEMDCRACHASGSGLAGMPAAGWVFDTNPQRDYRLNILRLHDEHQASNATFTSALATAGYDANGLYSSVVNNNVPILCAKCHLSEALPGSGIAGISPLTQNMHAMHGAVTDPTNGLTLEASENRSSCYRCHPGSETRCLRGAMGKAVAPDGTMLMQCQSCHGSMSVVGASTRTGWLDEPTCQNCHTGTATQNNGQIRYDTVFEAGGQMRQAVNATFATNANTPAAGLSLYRFSTGHGGLYCEACHGSTHAEFPSFHRNDNIYSINRQGHEGTLVECTSCHATTPSTVSGGPHGMHPVGQTWVSRHHDVVEDGGEAECAACHGTTFTGTVLSRSQANRTLSAFGTKNFWRGYTIGCYTCHNGPDSESATSNRPPAASNAAATTSLNTQAAIPLMATDAQGQTLTLRIVSQTMHGTVGLVGTTATYFPDTNFAGVDSFTFAASDGQLESNLGVAAITAGSPSSIFGKVVAGGNGVGNAVITLTSGGTTVATTRTDTTGAYWFNGLQAGSYVVTPARAGFIVSPASRSVALNGTTIPAANNFTAVQVGSAVLTILKSTVNARGTAAVTKGPLWNVSGTGTPGAAVSIYLGDDTTGQLIGTVTINKRGKWAFKQRALISAPITSVTNISVSSSDGQSLLNQPLTHLTSWSVSTKATQALTLGPKWSLRGTAVPKTTLSIYILKSDLVTRQLLAMAVVSDTGAWKFSGRVADTLPLTDATTLSIVSSAGGEAIDIEMTTVTRASVSAKSKTAAAKGPAWNIKGKGVPGTTVTIYLGPNLTGQLIGSATVSPTGAWKFSGRVPVTLPITATSISVSSSAGGEAIKLLAVR